MHRRIGIAVAVLLVTASCRPSQDPDRPTVVTGFYPLHHAVAAMVTEAASVVNLTPPGAEPHDAELTTDQLDAVLDADLVVYLGGGFQPALEEALRSREGQSADVLAAVTEPGDREDPHVWLDPVLWARAADAIADAIADAGVPLDEGLADAFATRVRELDEDYRAGLSRCARDLIVTSHDAFGRLAERYGLRVEPIAGISPESEPDPARLDELAALVEREGVTTIFTETLVPPEVAETLAREVGVRTDVLDPVEGVASGGGTETYFSLMEANLRALRRALGCE